MWFWPYFTQKQLSYLFILKNIKNSIEYFSSISLFFPLSSCLNRQTLINNFSFPSSSSYVITLILIIIRIFLLYIMIFFLNYLCDLYKKQLFYLAFLKNILKISSNSIFLAFLFLFPSDWLFKQLSKLLSFHPQVLTNLRYYI